jgi:predicted nucleic acid-binding protein
MRDALLRGIDRGWEWCIAPQCVFEFWVVATRPARVNGYELSAYETRGLIEAMLGANTLLPDPPDLVVRWADLCERYQVLGRPAHDALLPALMLSHGVTHLLTLNPADFTRYREITVLEPQDV